MGAQLICRMCEREEGGEQMFAIQPHQVVYYYIKKWVYRTSANPNLHPIFYLICTTVLNKYTYEYNVGYAYLELLHISC